MAGPSPTQFEWDAERTAGERLANTDSGLLSQSAFPPGIEQLWAQSLGDPGVTIAILDGPVDAGHPSLAASELQVIDFLGCKALDGPASHHGTHTASVIFGRHDGPVKGIAPQCRGVIVPIFRDGARGIRPCAQPDLARAIRLAANAGAQVINISAGEFSSQGVSHPMLEEAVRESADAGRLIVAAAGNNGCECLHVPGAIPTVLPVGAMDPDGNPMDFSNWGTHYQSAGILAPGVNILGAVPRDGVCRRTGTSFAAPIVSGVAGLLLSLQRKRGLPVNAQAVRAALLNSAQGCEHREVPDCRRLLAGRLNVNGAAAEILQGARTMSDSPTTSQSPVNAASEPAVSAPQAASPPPEPVSAAEPQATAAPPAAPASTDAVCPVSPGPPVGNAPPPGSTASRAPRSGVAAAVTASDCACQQNGELVYAIGHLDIDFGTQARLDSINNNIETFNVGRRLEATIHGHFLRHLFGWRELDSKPPIHKPHMYEAKSAIWVLRQDESPVYAIAPSGPFSEAAYEEIARFLLEQEGYDETFDDDEGVYPSLDTEFDNATRAIKEPNRMRDQAGNPVPIVERVAIPGVMNGTVELYSGEVIPVICPEMRGTRSWSMPELHRLRCEFAGEEDEEAEEPPEEVGRMRYLDGLQQRFFEVARNEGLTPEERALNFLATVSFRFVSHLQKYLQLNYRPELDDIVVKPSPTCRKDSLCYDVELEFFNPANVLESKTVMARTVDVSDVVPVPLGDPRIYRRR